MTEKITATVTRANWRENFGTRSRGTTLVTDCLIARALREATGDEWIVGTRDAARRRDYLNSSPIRYRLDRRTQRMLIRWMGWGSIARYLSRPFTFTIEPIEY